MSEERMKEISERGLIDKLREITPTLSVTVSPHWKVLESLSTVFLFTALQNGPQVGRCSLSLSPKKIDLAFPKKIISKTKMKMSKRMKMIVTWFSEQSQSEVDVILLVSLRIGVNYYYYLWFIILLLLLLSVSASLSLCQFYYIYMKTYSVMCCFSITLSIKLCHFYNKHVINMCLVQILKPHLSIPPVGRHIDNCLAAHVEEKTCHHQVIRS